MIDKDAPITKPVRRTRSIQCRRGNASDFATDIKVIGDELILTTRAGIKIHVCQGDMLRQSTEVIVNAANYQLVHGGGLAKAILMAGGPIIETESRNIIEKNGPVKVGEVVHTSAGKLPHPIRYVVHAVAPSRHELQMNGKEGHEKLVSTFYRSLEYSNDELHAQSISIPPFGTGSTRT